MASAASVAEADAGSLLYLYTQMSKGVCLKLVTLVHMKCVSGVTKMKFFVAGVVECVPVAQCSLLTFSLVGRCLKQW